MNDGKRTTYFVAGLLASSVIWASCSYSRSGYVEPHKEAGAGDPLQIQMMVEQIEATTPDMNNEYYTELQRRTGVRLDMQWIPSGDYPKHLDTALASGNLPEVLSYDTPSNPTLIKGLKKGLFWNLTPLLGDLSEYPNLKANATRGVFNFVKYKAEVYAVPRSRSWIDKGIKIRKDWLDKLQIPLPRTLDEYADALKRMVDEDPDGNGKADTIGLVDPPFTESFMGAFGLSTPTYNEEGGLIRDLLTPQAIELVGWFHGLYKEGVLAKSYPLIKRSYAQELLQKGKVASLSYSIYYDYKWQQEIQASQKGAELITLPIIQGPYGNTAYLQKGYTGAFYISKKVPEAKVKRILAYFDQTASKELTHFAYYGLEGVHHTLENNEPRLTELGRKQMSVTTLQPLATGYEPWSKVHNWAAPKAYNDAKKSGVAMYEVEGKQNPFDWLASDTWSEIWPRYKDEFDSKVLAAVTGAISMEQFGAYVTELRNNGEMKKAFLEFSEALQISPAVK
ncbi:extracellular solute-binding protein [Paenibacillus agricola]|uniref:Extracellular solute-binding protein n=1 Tax=Paenibacillus agricola TaxID=2716264 RepID=A0ABX0J4I0_9BACL|nr:extracellular solute-binding protein [Paenibacillus agricola]NHN29021.1 extracellular solute-binding protein [Paenibacillus agricola]